MTQTVNHLALITMFSVKPQGIKKTTKLNFEIFFCHRRGGGEGEESTKKPNKRIIPKNSGKQLEHFVFVTRGLITHNLYSSIRRGTTPLSRDNIFSFPQETENKVYKPLLVVLSRLEEPLHRALGPFLV